MLSHPSLNLSTVDHGLPQSERADPCPGKAKVKAYM